MYADKITDSMQFAIDETSRRRSIRETYNKKHGITPKTINKKIRDVISATVEVEDTAPVDKPKKKLTKKERLRMIEQIEHEMKEAAKALDFERATELRDALFELKAEG